MSELKPGDRVYVNDPGLAAMRDIMRRNGYEPFPNHHGTVHEVTDGLVIINFDSEDGAGLGAAAPYERHEVHLLSDGGGDA